jgi:hypothetical protein
MPYGNFNRNQALLGDGGSNLLIGGPIDPDVRRVIEVCAWIVQGLDNGEDAAATEMADVYDPVEQTQKPSSDKLLLFKKLTEAEFKKVEDGDAMDLDAPDSLDQVPLVQVSHDADPGSDWSIFRGKVEGEDKVLLVKGNGTLRRGYKQIEPTDDFPSEWLMVVEKKGTKDFAATHSAVALAIAKAETKDGMERMESWAQTVRVVVAAKDQVNPMVVAAKDPENLLKQLFPDPAEAAV